jgi:hypothetical protein
LTERVTNSAALLNTSGVKYALYALFVGIIIATILMIIDTFFPFLPLNPISGPSAVARAGVKFWPTEGENLIVPVKESPTVLPNAYGMSIQMMIGAASTASQGLFRHVVHRGTNPVAISASTAGSSGHSNIRMSDLTPDTEATYVSTGLPAIMNPGLFLDPLRNDLHIFVHTTKSEGPLPNVLVLESITVADLPLQTPLTIGVMCTGQTLEVYVNCRLYSTLLLTGKPYWRSASADNQWFGLYGAAPMAGLVKNLTLWATPIGSSDYMKMCRSPSFDKNDLPALCST